MSFFDAEGATPLTPDAMWPYSTTYNDTGTSERMGARKHPAS